MEEPTEHRGHFHAELDTLEELGVPSVQGFFLCWPKPLEKLKVLLENPVLEAN